MDVKKIGLIFLTLFYACCFICMVLDYGPISRRFKILVNLWTRFILQYSPGLQKTDFLPVQTDFYFVKPIQFA